MKDLYPSRGEEEYTIERKDPTVYGSKKIEKYSLNKNSLEQYERNGFIVFPKLFKEEEVAQMLQEVDIMANNDEFSQNEEFITEPDSNKLRTIFSQHLFSSLFEKISKDPRILDKVQQILDDDVYIQQSRINIKPAYKGKSFPWHSDFETWHCEDGIPRCKCLTAWIMLTDNTEFNGPLYLIPGSHKTFVSCKGETPVDNYKRSLKKQEYGVPSHKIIKRLSDKYSLQGAYGRSGTLVIHDGNIMHGSPDNISPYPRTNTFFVYNSINNIPTKPFGAPRPRAEFLCLKDYKPIQSESNDR